MTTEQAQIVIDNLEVISGYASLVSGALLCITFGIGLLCAMQIFDVRD